MYYSKSTKGFYAPEVHGAAIPDDAIKIEHSLYAALLAGQSEGKEIVTSESGTPALANPPPPAPPAPPDYLAQIEALEREHMAPKWQRDFTLGSMEREAVSIGAGQGLTPEQSIAALRAGNPGYRKLKELDEQIAALRELL